VVTATVASLVTTGATYEEQTLGGELIRMRPDVRRMVTPEMLGSWLDHPVGWAEVDSLCQSTFPAEQLLADWPAWSGLIEGLSLSPNINRRRASLVLPTGPVAHSDDPRLRDLCLHTIDRLGQERPILITKAVSWLLRSMVRRHPAEVARYIHDHADQLPAVAVRETTRVLTTGTKSGRRPAR
jgi:3-methyladenine DNA glycosylase AlkD